MSILKKLNACKEGQEWGDSQESYEQAWNICERGDWLLWIAAARSVDIKKIVGAKVEIARLVQHLMKDERSLNALDVGEKFSKGEASLEELKEAADAADAAADADADDVADSAAYCAVYAAYSAAVAAAVSAYSAYSAVDAVSAARKGTLSKAADIVREHIKFEDLNYGDINV